MHSSTLEPGASRVYPGGSCLRKQKGAPGSSWPGESGGQGCLQGPRPAVKHLLFRWPRSQSPGAALGSARVHKHGQGVHLLPGVRPQPWPRSPSHSFLPKTLPSFPGVPGTAFSLFSQLSPEAANLGFFRYFTPNSALADTSHDPPEDRGAPGSWEP